MSSIDGACVIVTRDTERQRDMYWVCHLNRFSYYEEAATQFDSESDAQVYMRYARIRGEIRSAEALVKN
jgi:hypothetical protein